MMPSWARSVAATLSNLAAHWNFFPKKANTIWTAIASAVFAGNHRRPSPTIYAALSVARKSRSASCTASKNLADRPAGTLPARLAPYTNIVPLPEVLGEVYGVGSGAKRVQQEYEKLLAKIGPELTILRHSSLDEIATAGGARLAEAIGRIRRGEIVAHGGYDGEYGTIEVFASSAADEATPQLGLFVEESPLPSVAPGLFDLPLAAKTEDEVSESGLEAESKPDAPVAAVPLPSLPAAEPSATIRQSTHTGYVHEWLERLNADQRAAATCLDAPLVIVAGPGTGKTRTLTVRIANLLTGHSCRTRERPCHHLYQQSRRRDARSLAGAGGRGSSRSANHSDLPCLWRTTAAHMG